LLNIFYMMDGNRRAMRLAGMRVEFVSTRHAGISRPLRSTQIGNPQDCLDLFTGADGGNHIGALYGLILKGNITA
jgi:hypothetical protein